MKRSIVVTVLVTAALVTGCGVSAQDEPEPLGTSSTAPEPMPTLTQRPDPPSTSSPTPEPTSSTAGASQATVDE